MPFSEPLKLETKKRAAFCCCRCHKIGIEVHHILPESEGGASTRGNAAPLCPNCHTWFGDNPRKRKEIRQMRDWWYEVCEAKYGGQKDSTSEKLDSLIGELRRQGTKDQERQKTLGEIVRTLKQLVETSGLSETDGAEEVASKVDRVVTATRLGSDLYANVHCKNCGTAVGLLVGSSNCPGCGAPI